jgi:phosphodiester glycosidase/sporulation related protein/S-layer family protein
MARLRSSRVIGSLVLGIVLGICGASALAQTQPSDIRGSWAEPRIMDLITRGIIAPSSDGAFRPDDQITRALFVSWLVAARGLPIVRAMAPTFTDVPLNHEASQAVETGVTFGVLPWVGGPFYPSSGLARGDAAILVVRALGYTFEASYMVNARLPYQDADGLPPGTRGAIAVATLTNPPLFREPTSDRVRPLDGITRAEAASLIWSYLQAVDRGVALTITLSLGDGVTVALEKRGALRVVPLWRVQVGSFPDSESARRLADAMRARGWPVIVELVDDQFKVRVGGFGTRAEALVWQERLTAAALPAITISTLREYEGLPGPFWWGTVVIEPGSGARIRPSLARETVGLGRTSEAARRTGAVVAINGGYFSGTGDPLGCLIVDGEVLSEPINGRTCAGVTDDGQLLFDTMRLDASVSTEAGQAVVNGMNRERGTDEIIVYRAAFGPTTRTNAFGAEVVVSGENVQSVTDGRGNAAIPSDGFVLSGHGRARQLLVSTFKPGDRVSVRGRLVPTSGDTRWDGVRYIFGGGPRVLANGQYVGGERFNAAFSDRRHPRTAVGRMADGRVIFLVVGGRPPYHSVGMTLIEIAGLLRQMGVTDALNLDGGGSTTLAVRGVVINLPSDETGERPVSDVLLVLPPASSGN